MISSAIGEIKLNVHKVTNGLARDISKTSKKAGRDIKAEKNRVKSKAHGAATEAGKSMKDTVLKQKP